MNEPRPVIVAGNWKMNSSPGDAGRLAAEIARVTELPGVTRVLCPPYVCLPAVKDALAGSSVAVGAQNVHGEQAGAYTGEVSAAMLTGLATWCIVGHSERRRDQGETDEDVARKLVRCAEHGLRPIMCVGEQLAERQSGRAEATVRRQLTQTIAELLRLGSGLAADLVIAYEPVWAIGTGRNASPEDAGEMAEIIRTTVADRMSGVAADGLRILYGGSVNAGNIKDLMAKSDVDGGLVGGASLDPDSFAAIVRYWV